MNFSLKLGTFTATPLVLLSRNSQVLHTGGVRVSAVTLRSVRTVSSTLVSQYNYLISIKIKHMILNQLQFTDHFSIYFMFIAKFHVDLWYFVIYKSGAIIRVS